MGYSILTFDVPEGVRKGAGTSVKFWDPHIYTHKFNFVNLKIIDCTEFDLYAIPNEKL